MRRSSINGYIPSRNRTFCEGFSSPASYCFNLFPNVFCSLTVPLNRLPDISDRKKAAFEIVAVSSFGFSRRYRLHTIYQSCSDFVSSLVELCLGPLFCPPGFTARCLLFGDCETCRRAIELGGACFRGLLRTVSEAFALMRGLLRTGEVEPSAWCPSFLGVRGATSGADRPFRSGDEERSERRHVGAVELVLVFCWVTTKPRSVDCDCFVLLPGRCKWLRQPNPSAHCTRLSRNISLQPNTAVCRPTLQCTQKYFPRSAWGALQSGPREQRPFDGLLPSFMSKSFKTEWFSESIRLTSRPYILGLFWVPQLQKSSAAAPKAIRSP